MKEVHEIVLGYSCPFCDNSYQFSNVHNLKKHVKNVHAGMQLLQNQFYEENNAHEKLKTRTDRKLLNNDSFVKLEKTLMLFNTWMYT